MENHITEKQVLELTKAFDTVIDTKLLTKLHSYGIRGIMLEIMNDYLHERKQLVRINDTKTDLPNMLVCLNELP